MYEIPVISIVIPVYNVEKYVAECIDSICNQWQKGIEIILVDDGSTDSSGAICEEYAEKYDYITVIHQKNKGLGGARNTGTQKARGEYIAWIDSDDVVDSTWLTEILQAIVISNPDLIFYDYVTFGAKKDKKFIYGNKSGLISKEQFIDDVMRDIKIQAYAWQKVIKREICLKEMFVEDKMPLEDYEIMYRLLSHLKSVYYINKILYRYRQRADSLIRGHDFNQSWHSYLLAVKRFDMVAEQYKNAAIAARCIQGYRLCKFDNIQLNKHDTIRKKCIDVRKYIRNNLLLLVVTPENTVKWKLKFFYIAFGIDLVIEKSRSKLKNAKKK